MRSAPTGSRRACATPRRCRPAIDSSRKNALIDALTCGERCFRGSSLPRRSRTESSRVVADRAFVGGMSFSPLITGPESVQAHECHCRVRLAAGGPLNGRSTLTSVTERWRSRSSPGTPRRGLRSIIAVGWSLEHPSVIWWIPLGYVLRGSSMLAPSLALLYSFALVLLPSQRPRSRERVTSMRRVFDSPAV